MSRRRVLPAFAWQIAAVALAALLFACAPARTPTAAPTQTLIPPTATPPLMPVDALPPTVTPELLIPAGAQALVNQAMQDLADRLDGAPVEVAALEATTWADGALGCGGAAGDGETPGYRIVLRSGSDLYEYHTDEGETVRQCEAAPDAEATLMLNADPMAAELVMMAQQRLAADLDLSTRRIRVEALEPVTWTDTSLNCPSPDVTYAPAEIGGYRLVLSAGDQQYIFHADFERLILCPPGQEALPEATPEAE